MWLFDDASGEFYQTTPSDCTNQQFISNDTPIAEFQAPSVSEEVCYTLMPRLAVEVPPVWFLFDGGDVGVPGLSLCVWWISYEVQFLGFDTGNLNLMVIGLSALLLVMNMIRRNG